MSALGWTASAPAHADVIYDNFTTRATYLNDNEYDEDEAFFLQILVQILMHSRIFFHFEAKTFV